MRDMDDINDINDDEEPVEGEEFDLDLLEEELRRAAAILDPVPPELRQIAVEAFALHDLDAEIAELTFDSAVDALPVRGAVEAPRMLTFHAGGLTVDVELSAHGLMGQVLPPQTARVEVLRGPQARAHRSPPTPWAASPTTNPPPAPSPSDCGPARRPSSRTG